MISNTGSPDTRPIAYFDFDGTLTTGDTLMPFLKFVVGAPAFYANLAIVSPLLIAYATKLLRNDIAKQCVLKQYLAGRHEDELIEYGQRFSEEVVPRMLRPEGMELLRWHKSQGHECVLISASINYYLVPWANSENFSDVLCTTLERSKSGHISGKIEHKNCYGQEKKKRALQWQSNKTSKEIYAYGDKSSDIPILKMAKYGKIWCRKENIFKPLE